MENIKNEIQAAVKWWSNILQSPTNHDNGEIFLSFKRNLMSTSLEPLTEEQIKTFEHFLAFSVKDAYQESWNNKLWINVDYHPCDILEFPTDQAQIKDQSLRFPVKTSMYIERNNKFVDWIKNQNYPTI